MSSIRNAWRASISAAILTGLGMGCSHAQPKTEALNERPLIVDGAMQQRDWQTSDAIYQNGSIKSYATRSPYVPSANRPGWAAPIVETPIFLGETLLLPVSVIRTPLGTSRVYSGVQFGPTSTGIPALPPSVSEQGATPGYPNAPAGATPNAPAPLPAPAEPAPEASRGNTPSNSSQTPAPAGGSTPAPGSPNNAAPSNPPTNSGTPVQQ